MQYGIKCFIFIYFIMYYITRGHEYCKWKSSKHVYHKHMLTVVMTPHQPQEKSQRRYIIIAYYAATATSYYTPNQRQQL